MTQERGHASKIPQASEPALAPATSPYGLTEEQRDAVLALEPVVFVSAGAGTGKTSVLVARFVELVLRRGIAPQAIAAVTFTRRAAGELRARIRAELTRVGRTDLLPDLERAALGTIHSLCHQVIRWHGLERGLHAGVRILDEGESALLLEESLAQAWQELVAASSDEELTLLVRHDRAIREAARKAFQAMRAAGHPHPRLNLRPHWDIERERQSLIAELAAAEKTYSELAKVPNKTAEENIRKVRILAERLSLLAPEPESIAILQLVQPKLLGSTNESLFGKLKEAIVRFRAALGEEYAGRLSECIDKLLILLDGYYTQAKAEREALDFADLEIEAIGLLEERNAQGVEERPLGIRHLLVDEFQDTNAVQCRLFTAFRPDSVMYVGDYFQSIYGFRNADCEVYKAQRDALWAGGHAPPPGEGWVSVDGKGRFAPLTISFRAEPRLLEVLNRVFGSQAFFGDEYQPLRPPFCLANASSARAEQRQASDADPRAATPAVQLVVVEPAAESGDELSAAVRARIESYEVARRVVRLLECGWRRRDIVILLRRLTYVSEYAAALRAMGIDSYVVGGRGYYALEEITDLLALLRVVAGSSSDVDVATLLRSPMVGLSDDSLFRLGRHRKLCGLEHLWDAVEQHPQDLLPPEDENRTTRLVAGIQRLRRHRAVAPSLSSIVDKALEEFDFDLVLLGSPDGRRRYANVRKLIRMADAFEDIEGPDLVGFLTYVEQLSQYSDREGEAAVLAEDEDVVRLMTVHQAKGLEFPVVVVADLGSTVRPTTPSVLVGRDSRAGLRFSISSLGCSGPQQIDLGPYEDLRAEWEARQLEEEKRICYVAATRAQKHLLLVGTMGKNGEFARTAPLVWFLEAVEWNPAEEEKVVYPLDGFALAAEKVRVGLPVAEETSADFEAPAGAALSPRDFPQDKLSLQGLHRWQSFSSLATFRECPRRYYLERVLGLAGFSYVLAFNSEDDAVEIDRSAEYDEPEVLAQTQSTAIGTVVHKVLERIDLQGPVPGRNQLALHIQSVAESLNITLSPDDLVRCSQLVCAFWESPLKSLPIGRAEREFPFALELAGVVVRGVMDLVIQDGSDWHVVDYKTTRLNGRSVADCAGPYILQLHLYSLAALRGGAESVTSHLLFLEKPQEPFSLFVGQNSRNRLEEEAISLLEQLRAGSFVPSRSPSEGDNVDARCRGCPGRESCFSRR